MSNFSVVISAPSGTGKTTIIQNLIKRDDRFMFSISTTTRPCREDEIPGESYNFVKEAQFLEMIDNGAFIEWARVHENYYGTPKKEIDRIQNTGKIPLFDVDVQGAKILQSKLNDAVFIFIAPPSLAVLEGRLRNRMTESAEQIKIRLRNSIKELREYGQYEYIIVNEDLDSAVEKIRSIITAELCQKKRISNIIERILNDESDNSTE